MIAGCSQGEREKVFTARKGEGAHREKERTDVVRVNRGSTAG
jgi:hypothetical protein